MPITVIKHHDDGVVTQKKGMKKKEELVQYPLICDKLSITLDIPDEHAQQQIIQQIQLVSEEPLNYLTAKGHYHFNLHIGDLCLNLPPYMHSEDQKFTGLHVQCSPKFDNWSFLRIEFTPSHIKDLTELHAQLYFIFLESGLSYQQIFEKGKVTRIDWSVDIPHHRVDECLFYYSGLSRTEKYYSKNKTGSTEYIGAETGGKRLCIYDKKAQIKEQKNKLNTKKYHQLPVPQMDVLRVELRLRPDCTLEECLQKNPFEKFTISHIDCLYPKNETWELFLALARFEGAQSALCRLNKKTKSQFVSMLKQHQVEWWKADKIWKQAPGLIEQIMGSNL